MKKMLFTTAVEPKPDYFYISVRRKFFRFSLPTPSFGLRFLHHNLNIPILEYPTWKEFKKKISNGLDILGISFDTAEIPIVLQMIQLAREAGVSEIWGGNYGVLTEGIEQYFDKIFVGYGERPLAKKLDLPLDRIKHPPIITTFGMKHLPFNVSHAFLFTTRGCKFNCSFCQTPIFVNGVSTLPIKSIEEVLEEYRKRKVQSVFIMDDNFFEKKDYSEQVIDMFHEKGLNWGVCTREHNLKGRIKEFKDKGMFMCIIGVESVRQENLNSIRKGINLKHLVSTIKELHHHHIYIHGTYMIGYEDDTADKIKQDIEKLAQLRLQSSQISILTPLPQTPLWDKLDSKYGINTDDYSLFDTYHLVWNHPHISAQQMDQLLKYAWNRCYPRLNNIRNLVLLMRHGVFWRFINPLR